MFLSLRYIGIFGIRETDYPDTRPLTSTAVLHISSEANTQDIQVSLSLHIYIYIYIDSQEKEIMRRIETACMSGVFLVHRQHAVKHLGDRKKKMKCCLYISIYLKEIAVGDREGRFHQTVDDLVMTDIRLNHPIVLER